MVSEISLYCFDMKNKLAFVSLFDFHLKDILLKVREYIDYKNAPKILEILADKLKALARVAKTNADLKVVDAKTQCLYNGYIAYVNKRDIQYTLKACGMYI